MEARRQVGWALVAVASLAGATIAAIIAWHINLQAIDRQVEGTRARLKKLILSGRIPPNEEVMAYLQARERVLTDRYQQRFVSLTAPPLAAAAAADPQLYFQEQLHEVQRMLERVAVARSIPVPEQLGFPKELPPSDTVPRLLVQLSLIKELAGLVLERGVIGLSSLKIEDPEEVPEAEQEDRPFLKRLPVRVRLTSTLPQLLNVLGAIEAAKPLIDVRSARLINAATPEQLEVELVVARYLVAAEQPLPTVSEDTEEAAAAKPTSTRRREPAAIRPGASREPRASSPPSRRGTKRRSPSHQ